MSNLIGRGSDRGFTLLEVLIAFAIAAIALVLLYRGAIDGLLGSRVAARTDEAVARARSRMAALCQGATVMPGQQSGDDGGGFSWQTQINRAAEAVARGGGDQSAPMRVDLFTVRVTVNWPGSVRQHQVALETRCLSVGAADRP